MRKITKRSQFLISCFIISSLLALRGDGGIAAAVKYNGAIIRNLGVILAGRDLRNEAIWEPMRKITKRSQSVINHFIINSLPSLRGDGGIATPVKYNRAIMHNFGVVLEARDLRNEAIWGPMRKMAKQTQFLINRRPAEKPNTNRNTCCTAVPAHETARTPPPPG